MKRGQLRRARVINALSRDLLARIRRAEWFEERKREAVKDRQREQVRPQSCESWRQIVQVMR